MRAVIVLEKFFQTFTGEAWRLLLFGYGNFKGRFCAIDGLFLGDL